MADTPHQITVDVVPGLSVAYARQREIQRVFLDGQTPAELDPARKMSFMMETGLAIMKEVGEALDETGWKPWAKSNHINEGPYKGELADVMIFLMNMMLMVDMTPGEMIKLVLAKQKINLDRQASGYDGVTTKCPGCKRAYDDPQVLCCEIGAAPFIGVVPIAAVGIPVPVDAVGWCDGGSHYVNKMGNGVSPSVAQYGPARRPITSMGVSNGPYVCIPCDVQGMDLDEWRRHANTTDHDQRAKAWRIANPDVLPSDMEMPKPPSPLTYACGGCDVRGMTQEEYLAHHRTNDHKRVMDTL